MLTLQVVASYFDEQQSDGSPDEFAQSHYECNEDGCIEGCLGGESEAQVGDAHEKSALATSEL